MDEPEFKRYHIYCDESCTKGRFTTIGAFVCHESLFGRIEDAIERAIKPHGGTSELKWSKVKRKNLPMYKDVVDLFFQLTEKDFVHYYCLVVDNSKVDHKTYNEGDEEIGFNKMLFTHLYTFARKYRSRPMFYAYLDDRTTRHTPERMRQMLNARAHKDLHPGYDLFRVCQFRKSHEVRCIQLTDVITGAIGAATNRHDLKIDAAAHKKELIRHTQVAAKVPSLAIPTPIRTKNFDIWHVDFSKSKRKRVPRT